MEFLASLWLPILLSAVFVFIVSSVFHMVLPIHKGDYRKVPQEDTVMSAMRSAGLQPGHYILPCPDSMKEAATPEMIEKYNRGPVGYMTVLPNGPINIGRSLLQWFVFTIVIGGFAAYLGHSTLGDGATFLAVFRVTGIAAVLAYALSHVPDSIWKGSSWTITGKFVFDGTVYGLVTAATLGWLWPAAA